MTVGKCVKLEYPDLQSNIEFYHEGNYRGLGPVQLQELFSILSGKEKEVEDEWRDLYATTLQEISDEQKRVAIRAEHMYLFLSPEYKQGNRKYSANCYSTKRSGYFPLEIRKITGSHGPLHIYRSMSNKHSIKLEIKDASSYGYANISINDIIYYTKDLEFDDLKKVKYLYVGDLLIDKKLYGDGYGRDLGAVIEQIARENDCDLIIATVIGNDDEIHNRLIEKTAKYGYNQKGNVIYKILSDRGEGFVDQP